MRGIVALSILTLFGHTDAFADAEFLQRTLGMNGQEYRYQVYIPKGWSPTTPWPVIVNLHPNGSQGSDGQKHMQQSSLAAEVRANPGRFPALVLFPQAREGTAWSTPLMQEMVLAQVTETVRDFSGDVDRIYLAGFSMGGGGVVRMASKWPGRFAALIDMAGRVSTGYRPGRPPELVEEDIRSHEFLQSPNPFEAAARLIRSLPIWVVHGDADKTVPVEESRQLVTALKSVGANVHYTEYPGGEHNPELGRRAWADTTLVEWLLSQRRSAIK